MPVSLVTEGLTKGPRVYTAWLILLRKEGMQRRLRVWCTAQREKVQGAG